MGVPAGTLSDRIVFQARTISGDGEGRATTWPEAFRCAAEPQRTSELSARFIIRYRSGIGPDTHRIIWDGKIWNITSAVHDLRRTILTIECDGSELIPVTDIESTTEEYIDGLPVVRPEEE